MRFIKSQFFGEIKLLDDKEEMQLQLINLIKEYPADAFGILNKMFNSLGYILTIGKLQ